MSSVPQVFWVVLSGCRLPMPRPGQVLGLVGTNGIGKSTALKVLAGKLKPNLGRFSVSGKRMAYDATIEACTSLHVGRLAHHTTWAGLVQWATGRAREAWLALAVQHSSVGTVSKDSWAPG